MKRFSYIIALVAALIVSAVYASTGTDGHELSPDQHSGSGSIVGNRGGAFNYYWFNYGGGNETVVVALTVNQSHQNMGAGVGFNVYDSYGELVGHGRPPDGRRSSTSARLSFSRNAGGRFQIQVYNYVEGGVVNYWVQVAGQGPSPPLQVTGATQPEDAPTLLPEENVLASSLPGNPAGAFHYYDLRYPGGNLNLSVTMSSSPPFLWSDSAVGMFLYRGDMLVAQGIEIKSTKSSVAHFLRYRTLEADNLTLQVFNYGTDHHIDYVLYFNGVSGEPIPASENHTPATAIRLTREQNDFIGAVPGSRVGSYSFFDLHHPGGSETIRIILSMPRENRAFDGLAGFNVYEGHRLVGQRLARRDSRGRFLAAMTIERAEAANFGIQVFNYNEALNLQYRLEVFGR